MTTPEERLRPRPLDRFAAAEHLLDLTESLRVLRTESRATANGHRQIALMHEGPVRLVLFAFEAHGRLPQHSAPGWVTIHVLRGFVHVRTPDALHALPGGSLLSLAPSVLHDVEAMEESDFLLGIYPESTRTE